MDIYFYNNHSPANVVRKKLDNETVISGTLKEDIEIINKQTEYTETEDGISVTVTYTLEGDIGITQEIMAKY